MVEYTNRDILWDATIQTARSQGKFSIEDVLEKFSNIKPNTKKTPSRSTMRDCLRTLNQMRYIQDVENEKDVWIISPRFLDPDLIFQVLLAILDLGKTNDTVKTRTIMEKAEIDSKILVLLSLKILEEHRFVHEKSDEQYWDKWFIEI